MDEKKMTTLRVNVELRDALKKEAKRTGRTMVGLVTYMLFKQVKGAHDE
jgi:predicted DNA-binding protein